MASNTHRASPQSKLFFGIAANATQVRNEKRNRVANRSGAHPIEARPPQTSLIDAEWDLEPFAPVQNETDAGQAHAAAAEPQIAAPLSVRPPQTSLIDAQWEAPPAASEEPRVPAISMRAPRTTAIDEEWEPPTVRATAEAQAKAILMSRASHIDEDWELAVHRTNDVPAMTTPRTSIIDEDWESIAPDTNGQSAAPAMLMGMPHSPAVDELELIGNAQPEPLPHEVSRHRQAPRGRSVAAVTLAALLAITAFGVVQGYKVVRHRALPRPASMLRHGDLPNGGAFVQEHWNASWLESGSRMASDATRALASAEAEAAAAKPLLPRVVVTRRAHRAAAAPAQENGEAGDPPAANTESVPATGTTPANAGEQAVPVSPPRVQSSTPDSP